MPSEDLRTWLTYLSSGFQLERRHGRRTAQNARQALRCALIALYLCIQCELTSQTLIPDPPEPSQ
jgi:hypothetical protein